MYYHFNYRGGKLGMAAAAAPMLAGMMSGKPGHNQGHNQMYGQSYGQGMPPSQHHRYQIFEQFQIFSFYL